MLVTFSCPAHADITLFGEVAIQLLKYMGHSGNVPGAILADDVAEAVKQLEISLSSSNQNITDAEPLDSNDDEPVISINMRAAPLIHLLKNAAAFKCDVMWSGSGQ